LIAVYDIIVSSAETVDVFNTGFGTVNLHGPTMIRPRHGASHAVNRKPDGKPTWNVVATANCGSLDSRL
jgi:hypothetical protein